MNCVYDDCNSKYKVDYLFICIHTYIHICARDWREGEIERYMSKGTKFQLYQKMKSQRSVQLLWIVCNSFVYFKFAKGRFYLKYYHKIIIATIIISKKVGGSFWRCWLGSWHRWFMQTMK
jgi:hypothetical protein